ncbi:three-Cys-motif partner protein TcmP [Actinoplanes sp. NPDC023801]|uniref:three-Cys-motif partner protein TcmP n=1 Tax=Actinoplanes sp. NPDC023801 TaxID=3154595 RepID=UPI0033FE40B4
MDMDGYTQLREGAVAKGTSSGLLDQQRTQSVFKHKLLEDYVLPFAEMTGSKVEGRRVVVVDGFAGRGRYPDGQPGSAELMLRTAERASRAAIEPILVEKKPADFKQLAAVAMEYRARGVRAETLPDDVLQHLPLIIERASGVPLFLFLDPCGANLPYDALAAVVSGPRRPLWPATEVLLNFSADLTRRASGALKAGLLDHDALPVMDRTCGGPWWREVALAAQASSSAGGFERAAFAVVEEYARRLGVAGGMYPMTIPVRRRVHHQPVYHLVFLTRRSHGVWVFATALAQARQEWMRALGPAEDDVTTTLFSFGDAVEGQIDAEQRQARGAVAANLRSLVAKRPVFRLVDQPWEIFGEAYGVATEPTVRQAIDDLERSRQIRVVERKRHVRDWRVARPETFIAPTRP